MIEKLAGRENYNSWKFAMRALLEHEDLWNSVLGTEQDEVKNRKARSKIILLVETINYVHIENATTAKQAWDNLKAAFEDSGLTRKVGLLRQLVTTRLDGCNSIDEYVNTIITTANKLNGIGFAVGEEWIGVLLLSGLPDEYKPMIMGLESSGVKITSDSIKTKLLQDVKCRREPKVTDSMALYTKKGKTDGARCYSCNKIGHFANQCRNKRARPNKSNGGSKSRAFYTVYATGASKSQENWYIDSCSTNHFTNDKDDWRNTIQR